jgi:heptosyltransferase-2
MAEISAVIDSPFGHGQLSLKPRCKLARELAARNYDAVYVLPNSLKSALVPLMAGIPKRVGFTGESRFGLINVRHTLDKAALPMMVERFAQLAEQPGTQLPKPVFYPKITSTVALQNQTLTELGLSRPARVIAFCPGAEYGPAKRWPAAHFAALAKKLAEQDCTIWLFGSPKDRAVAEEISQLAPGLCRNLCGATSLAQAIDLLAMAELVVCNDSGLMHVAAALERPLVTLYGSSSPGFTPPLSDQADILSLKLDCSPCFKRECPLGHLDCLNKLTPEYVLAAALNRMTA